MSVTIRGIHFQANRDNAMGLEFYNLSHRFGFQSPNWPYFEDVKIERIHYMAKSGVLSQRITTSMHNTTHIDAPARPFLVFLGQVRMKRTVAVWANSRCQRMIVCLGIMADDLHPFFNEPVAR